ncbi:MAG: hypothetical protein U0Q21_16305 [Dermatophilaceae bacterium]
MSLDLRDSLRVLADIDLGMPPASPPLWRRGRRRLWRVRFARSTVVATAVCAILLGVWPQTRLFMVGPVPAGPIGSALTTYPARIADPPSRPDSRDSSGAKFALLVSGNSQWLVAPDGSVSRLDGDSGHRPDSVSLSPDGHWLASGIAITDLTTGHVVPTTAVVDARRRFAFGSGYWSADSARVFAEAPLPPSLGGSMGVVLGVDGSHLDVPRFPDTTRPVTVAGWQNASTLLAYTIGGPGRTLRLAGYRWRIGDVDWTRAAPRADISWPTGAFGEVAAALSPSGERLLVRWSDLSENGSPENTAAMMFDPETGAAIGMPLTNGRVSPGDWARGSSLGWPGWGCRPAWRDENPIVTQGTIAPVEDLTKPLIAVSSRVHLACAHLAGDRIGDEPVPGWRATAQEWTLRRVLPMTLGVSALVGVVWWSLRRRRRA